MKPLSGLDGAFLHLETPETPMHVASLHVFDLPPHYTGDFHADVTRQVAERLHLAPVFTRRLAPMPLHFANPVWIDDEDVDLGYHVQRVTLPRPGTQAQLEDCVARLHAEVLDRDRPLWRLYVMDGLATGQAAYYIKVHHAVLDGQAGVLLARLLFDVTPTVRRLPPPARTGNRDARRPGMGALAAAALRHDAGQIGALIRHLPEVAGTLSGMLGSRAEPTTGALGQNFSFGPKTPLNTTITATRRFAGLSLPMAEIKRLAAAHGAKVNDIVLALCSGALRRYLAHRGGIPKQPLIALMPISLRDAGNTEFTTQATLSLVSLNTHIADPLQRLAAIRDAAGAMKSLATRAKQMIPTDFPSIATPLIVQALAVLYGRLRIADVVPPIANVVISNVPGPPVPLYAAGARMRDYWPLSIVEHGLGLNITVMSYAGTMGFGVTAARTAVPDARKIAAALASAFDELVANTPPAAASTTRRITPGSTTRITPGSTRRITPGTTARKAPTKAVGRRRPASEH